MAAFGLLAFLLILALSIAPYGFFRDPPDAAPSLPDFASFTDVKQKKKAFFDYFSVIIEQENTRLARQRKRIQALADKTDRDGSDEEWLVQLAETYQLAFEPPLTQTHISKLLQRVDMIPASLVLAQAAIESGWGTSRFAREGYNYFGLWCFSKGCGMLPAHRDSNANHEVQVFDSPADSVRNYMLNLNRHPAYRKVRQLRHAARQRNEVLSGCQLALGLDKYSSRGEHYVREVQQMIKSNRLGHPDAPPCQPLEIASRA